MSVYQYQIDLARPIVDQIHQDHAELVKDTLVSYSSNDDQSLTIRFEHPPEPMKELKQGDVDENLRTEFPTPALPEDFVHLEVYCFFKPGDENKPMIHKYQVITNKVFVRQGDGSYSPA